MASPDRSPSEAGPSTGHPPFESSRPVTLFLCGDVMTGRGIDQVLPHPGDASLHEPFCVSALDYVRLAEERSGPIRRGVGFPYVWGDALDELRRVAPDLRLVNLETAVTTSGDFEPAKEVHYRMNPANVGCLVAAGLDCCALANNHVLDWGREGLLETLETLDRVGLRTAGAGRDVDEAARPAAFELPGGRRVLIFACGCRSSGIPPDWAAGLDRPGVWLLDEGSRETVDLLAAAVRQAKQPGDVVLISVHWGGNWGFPIPEEQRRLAHRLIDEAGIDVIHGHSSHHVKGIEFYRGRPILYGCGDLLTDYEGIAGYERFRGDLELMYFVTVDAAGELVRLEMTPTRMERFRLTRPSLADAAWLGRTLTREGQALGTSVRITPDGRLTLSRNGLPSFAGPSLL